MRKLTKSAALERRKILLFLLDYHSICDCKGKALKKCRKSLIRQISEGTHHGGVTKDWSELYAEELKEILKDKNNGK